MKQNLLGLPLPVTGWFSIVLALAPYVLHAVGAQWPEALPVTSGLAKVIEKVITLGLPIDPTVGAASLAVAGAAALHKTKPVK